MVKLHFCLIPLEGPGGTNCAPLIADLFLYCYEGDFMSDLQKSKRLNLIDMFNDTPN